MFEIVLYEPEIPPNAGNIMRLCANTGCRLHFVRPLGFSLSDKHLARAGMDYRGRVDYVLHDDWHGCVKSLEGRRIFALTTRGSRQCHDVRFESQDVFVFGPETRGLPPQVLDSIAEERRLRLPMVEGSRSLNLSNAAAVVVYEAWRQMEFDGGS